METKFCYGCNLPIEGRSHYHDTAPTGATLTCRELNQKKKWSDSNSRVRKQSATLNGGLSLRRGDKSLKTRLDFLTIRSYADVAQILGCSAESVRLTEMKALDKLRKLLLPFKGATCGADKVTQVTKPIPC